MRLLPLFLICLCAAPVTAQTWKPLESGTTASLRGVSAVNERVAYASGTGGAWLVTHDGGATWKAARVEGAEKLDFRAVVALDERTVYLLSIGTGDQSRVYKTEDAGAHWRLLMTNPDAQGFWDEIAFWDARHAILLGDPVGGEFTVFTTSDAGEHWKREHGPKAIGEEGAFAASNSSLAVRGSREAWFATGGKTGARVFHSTDGGGSWTAAETPVRHDSAGAGIFSLGFRDGREAIAVGGDYGKAHEDVGTIAITADGGASWTMPVGNPKGYRSAAVWVEERKAWVVAGTSGSEISTDDSTTWRDLGPGNWNALAVSGRKVWAVGPRGRIAVLEK